MNWEDCIAPIDMTDEFALEEDRLNCAAEAPRVAALEFFALQYDAGSSFEAAVPSSPQIGEEKEKEKKNKKRKEKEKVKKSKKKASLRESRSDECRMTNDESAHATSAWKQPCVRTKCMGVSWRFKTALQTKEDILPERIVYDWFSYGMDPSMGKGSAPIRNSLHQISQSPLCSTGREIEDVCPLSDTHLDQSTSFPFEPVSGRPVNNCAKLYASWPAQVTITPVPFSNVYAQPPNCPSNLPPPAQISPQIPLPTSPGSLNINPNPSFGNQQVNLHPQKCSVVAQNCTPTVDGASNPPFNVIQPLCYGPVSEGHYVVLQPLCCYFPKEPSEKEGEDKAVLEKEEVDKEKNESSNKVEAKKNAKRKNKANRKARGQTGKHNSVGVVQLRNTKFGVNLLVRQSKVKGYEEYANRPGE
ncbi:hypothetical protein TcWFU_007293 [Taenia crassiceps]|uniref:Uncharacterized protein n=1 Tax=Taenia crassiceps TaxID=6207 RepID=A0ABR4Q024_9CEST